MRIDEFKVSARDAVSIERSNNVRILPDGRLMSLDDEFRIDMKVALQGIKLSLRKLEHLIEILSVDEIGEIPD
jgi:hypothetical protein